MDLGTRIDSFLNDPVVSVFWSFIVLAFFNFVFAVYESLRDGTFDWSKLPNILKTAILFKAFPLLIFGVIVKTVRGDVAEGLSLAAYGSAGAILIASEGAQLVDHLRRNLGQTPDFRNESIDGPTTGRST